MLPRHPILLGGFAAPLLWSGLIYGMLAIRQSGDEPAHRLALVCALANRIRNRSGARGGAFRNESLRAIVPLIARMGIEAPGIMPTRRNTRRSRTR